MSNHPKTGRTKPNNGRRSAPQTWSWGLLDIDPYDLREKLDTSVAVKELGVEFLLTSSEAGARAYLKANIPNAMTPALKLSDLYWAWREPRTFNLDERQEAAIAVLITAFSIRNLFIDFDAAREVGRPQWAPAMPINDARSLAEQIAFRMLEFTLATVRGDFIDSRQLEALVQANNKRQRELMGQRQKQALNGKTRVYMKKGTRCFDILKRDFKGAGDPYKLICLRWKDDWESLSGQDRRDLREIPPSKKQVERYFQDKRLSFHSDPALSTLSVKKR